jgi:hypothetical protein
MANQRLPASDGRYCIDSRGNSVLSLGAELTRYIPTVNRAIMATSIFTTHNLARHPNVAQSRNVRFAAYNGLGPDAAAFLFCTIGSRLDYIRQN